MLWRFAKGIIPTRDRIQTFANLVDTSCLVCSSDVETKLHIMAYCEVVCILWFRLLGLRLQNLNFANPLEFLATIIHVNDKFSYISDVDSKFCVAAATTIILNRV